MTNAHPWDADAAVSLIQKHASMPGALLPIFHALQEEYGYIHEDAIPLIASALNISKADVYGTLTFYHDFRTSPGGRHTMKVCRAEACQSMGCDALIEHIEGKLGVRLGETTADGSFTTSPIYCLGNCALSPSMMLDGKPFGRVSPQMVDALIDSARRERVTQ